MVNGKLYENEIFCPQAIIFVQTGILAQQIQLILKELKKHADDLAELQGTKLKLLNFTVGSMSGDKHKPGDIIVSVVKSFLNRNEKKNISFENCSMVALDEIDEIYDSGVQELDKILRMTANLPRTKVIACSATMKEDFLKFYRNIFPHYNASNLELNVNDILRK